MPPERKARLDALGWWAWSVRVTHLIVGWDARFDELVSYHAEHGTLPSQRMRGLGKWVDRQRATRATMSAERKAKLEALGWWLWGVRAATSPNSASSASDIAARLVNRGAGL